MKIRTLSASAVLGLLLVLATSNVFSQELSKAAASDSCTGFSLRVLGEHLTVNARLNYEFIITPASGPNQIANGYKIVGPDATGDFDTTITGNWSDYGITLTDTYSIVGKVRLNTVPEHKVLPIAITNKTLSCKVSTNACLSTSSLSVLTQGTTVTSYVPNGAWATLYTGLQVVPIEGSGTLASVATPYPVNSCSSNSVTGVTVCTGNNTDVYLVSGSTLTNTLTSGADSLAGFSGGSCMNCGVALNNLTNQAVVTIGLSTSPSGSGIQFLDLSNNSFGTPIASTNIVSEDVVWDQNRDIILSPSESGNYDIFQTKPNVAQYSNYVGQELDSGAEDCTTGIGLSAVEFTGDLYIADLTQAKYTGTTWSGAGQFQTFPEFVPFAAGTSGIAVAPGTHLAVVAGEFGGNEFGAVVLPATSGIGVPAVADYVAAFLPNTPDGQAWQQGLDPHTVTAFVSPNTNKAYALMANGAGVPPTYLAVVDLQALINAPRTAGTHDLDPSYDLLAHGVVRYVPTF